MGLFFCVESDIDSPKDELGCVWVLHFDDDDYVNESDLSTTPLSIEKTKIFRPRHIASRITAQSGLFTVHKMMNKDTPFVPLNKNAAYSNRLLKIVVPAKKFRDLRNKLRVLGVNEYSVYPDLDGLTKLISRQNWYKH